MKRLLITFLILTSAAARAAGAPDDGLESLMRAAFPGWQPGRFHAVTVTDGGARRVRIAVTPRLVLSLGEGHRSLVVSGVPNHGDKAESAGHAEAGSLGFYSFTRQGQAWVRTSAPPALIWTGFSGEVGRLKPVSLSAGQVGLAVENGSCWQGTCGEWLALYAVTPQGTRQVLQLMTASDSSGHAEECGDWLKGRLQRVPERYDAELCFAIAGQWQLTTPAGRSDADVVVRFKGREAVVDPKTGKPVVKSVDEALVMRRQGLRYEAILGRNPTHDI